MDTETELKECTPEAFRYYIEELSVQRAKRNLLQAWIIDTVCSTLRLIVDVLVTPLLLAFPGEASRLWRFNSAAFHVQLLIKSMALRELRFKLSSLQRGGNAEIWAKYGLGY